MKLLCDDRIGEENGLLEINCGDSVVVIWTWTPIRSPTTASDLHYSLAYSNSMHAKLLASYQMTVSIYDYEWIELCNRYTPTWVLYRME